MDRHKHHPIPVRLPEADRSWLRDYAERTRRAINAVIVQAIAEYRKRHESE